MKRRSFAGAVIWGKTAASSGRAGDVLYLVNYFSGKVGQPFDVSDHRARDYCAVVLDPGQLPEVFADDPGFHRSHIPTDRIRYSPDTVAAVARNLRAEPVPGSVAFVGSDFFAVKYWDAFMAGTTEIEWEICDDLILDLRRRKSSRELECCREAGAIAAAAMDRLMTSLVAGKTEREAAAGAANEIICRGGVVERINCTFGDKVGATSREPLTGYSASAPEPGDMVKGWLIGPMFQGYDMDPGRTAVAGGRPDPDQRRLIETCAEIVMKMAEKTRAGVSFKAVADVGDRLVTAFGGSADPMAAKHPFFGHPNGLYFEGPPYISNVVDNMGARFQAGDVIGLEAFLTLERVGSAGFEQNYIVHEDGVELITPSPEFLH
ncbi:MAG: M24 family metallopeptidase [Paracoccaceae bacterium]|nr:M24 family metallopeptidase [Paracoccaceae bacterium]